MAALACTLKLINFLGVTSYALFALAFVELVVTFAIWIAALF